MEKSRMEFLQEALTCEKSFKEICQDYGISRKTGYKWVDRYKSGEDLTNLSTRPLKSPNKISPEMENLIKSIREKHPYWGAKKLRKILENQGYTNLPSVTTFSNVIKRNGQITQEESQKHTAYKRFEKEAPNIMWQMDFKGEVKEKERDQYVYPLTIKDDKSRYCIEVKACRNQKFETVKAALIQCFREYGMPKIILSDNGKPWGDSKLDVVTKMDIWLIDLGIQPIHIRSKHPQSQGKVESLNKALKKELLNRAEIESFEHAQQLFDEWREQYNNVRPHEALNFDTPAMRYTKSSIKYKETLDEYQYPDNVLVKKVNHIGHVEINKRLHFLGEALKEKYVGFVKSPSFRNITYILYHEYIIATYDSDNNEITKIKLKKEIK